MAALELAAEGRTNPKPVDEVELKRSERELNAYAAAWFADPDESGVPVTSEPKESDPGDSDGRVIPFPLKRRGITPSE